LKLEEFQNRFQRAILDGDDTILDDIPDGPRETKGNLLGIYRDAYVLRLVDVIGNDHELLRRYLGADRFQAMARAYIAGFPSRHPNARWFSRRLPEFLSSSTPYSQQPLLGELAALERALSDAFDGVDAPVLRIDDLSAIPPQAWARLCFVCHPTATCLSALTNVAAIWTALKAGKEPPPSTLSKDATRILVWRHDRTAMFRELTIEEAMMWEETAKGTRFGDLCEMLAMYNDPASAPVRAAGILKTWLDAGLLSRAVPAL
jgi:hypothetical protein